MSQELLLHEWFDAAGARRIATLRVDGPEVVYVGEEGEALPLPKGAIVKVFERYGRPLAPAVSGAAPQVVLPEGGRLVALRHRARFDVLARDFLVLYRDGEPPLCELATGIAAALAHLAHAAARSG